jgi:hypothetical protein
MAGMGTWGPGIFSDDVAVDARDDYRSLVGEGRSGPEATDELLRKSKGVAEDDEDGIPFWLALASTQWKMGRLEPRVRDRALAIIDAGADLQRWEDDDPESVPKRRAALVKLRETLLTPQGPETKIRPRQTFKARFTPGDVISYRLPDGRYTVFRIVGWKRDHEGEFDIAELVDYFNHEPPTMEQATTLPPKPFGDYATPYIIPLILNTEAKRRIEVIGRTTPPAPPTYTKRRFLVFPKKLTGWEEEYTYVERWDRMEYEVLPAFGEAEPEWG